MLLLLLSLHQLFEAYSILNFTSTVSNITSSLDTVKLANGTVVAWDEFSKWSAKKQRNSLCPYRHFGERSIETRLKISESGKKLWALRKEIGPTIAPNRGVPHTDATKKKIGMKSKERMQGVPKTEAHRQAMREAAARRLSGQTEIVTPIGTFKDLSTAATALGITLGSLKYRLVRKREEYFYKK